MPAQRLLITKSHNVPSSSCTIHWLPTYAAEFLEFRKLLRDLGACFDSYISTLPISFFLYVSLSMSSFSFNVSLFYLYICDSSVHTHVENIQMYAYINLSHCLSIIYMMTRITIFINFLPLEVKCEIVYAVDKRRAQSPILFHEYWWGKFLLKISIL